MITYVNLPCAGAAHVTLSLSRRHQLSAARRSSAGHANATAAQQTHSLPTAPVTARHRLHWATRARVAGPV
eukprot:3616576-Pleurochrysis_carterae.AAC.2